MLKTGNILHGFSLNCHLICFTQSYCECCDLRSLRSKHFLDAGFSEEHIVGYSELALEMCHVAQKFQFVQVREKET